VTQHVGIQLDPRKARLGIDVIGPEPDHDGAGLAHPFLEITHERRADPLTLAIRSHGQAPSR